MVGTILLSVQDAENLILEHFGQYLSLRDEGAYFLYSLEKVSYITWMDYESPPDVDGLISFGLPICSFSAKRKWLFPSLMEKLNDYPQVEIASIKKAIDFSKGKIVAVSSFEELEQKQVLITHNGHPLAFGQILFGEFHPLIDVGWYLREAERGVF